MLGFLRDFLSRRSPAFIILTSLLIVAILGLIDYLTGPETAFSIFYLLPIFLVTWYARKIWAYTVAILSAFSWFLADILSSHNYSHIMIPIWNTGVRLGFFLIFTGGLEAIKRAFQAEKELARTDPLTGIANSRFFYESVSLEISRVNRTNEPMSFAYADVDDFKKINDSFGHRAGDELLRLMAHSMKQAVRAIDVLARIGGDEFIILLPNTDHDEAQAAVQRILRILSEAMIQHHWSVSFSFGVVTCRKPPANLDEIIKQADRLMYEAKKSGKNKIRHELYDPDHGHSTPGL
jgi:diguanylate cyclase (GGDEF)-like protein